VVTDGVTGFLTENTQDMIDAVTNLHLINRTNCRANSELYFDVPVIASKYLGLFK
jgi:hypothetical protein